MFGLLNNMPDERKHALGALGVGLSQLSAGQPVNLGPAHDALLRRQQEADARKRVEELGARFTPDQQAVLASMPPEAAIKVIAGQALRPPTPPEVFEVGDSLVDETGQVIYQAPSAVPERDSAKDANGRLRYLDTGEPVFPNVTVDPEPKELATVIDPSTPEGQAQLERFGIPATGSEPFEVKYRQMADGAVELVDVSIPGGRVQSGPTAGQVKLDEAYAADYLTWIQSGGADMVGQTAQISSVLEDLKAGRDLTGPMVGLQGDIVRSILNPEAQDAKERVESVVQRNLRIILGSQFTAQEGERLIARAYNINLKPEQNAARLQALFTAMEQGLQARSSMAQYFGENGTLVGFEPQPIPTVDSLIASMEEAASTAGLGDGQTLSDEELEYLGISQ